ncbi:hypothetical protein [Catenovulum sediminis]|uniref:Flagellar hook-length control protein-like C-terminal domain-containing protein n=1 Tax=Catenovulum sediminis TaxID=1740262 RepID=A0ABV1RKM6_9ALTE
MVQSDLIKKFTSTAGQNEKLTQKALNLQNQYQQAALQKVNDVMASLKFTNGAQLNLPLTNLSPALQTSIKTMFSQNNRLPVEAAVSHQNLLIKSARANLIQLPLSEFSTSQISKQLFLQKEASTPQGVIASAQISNNKVIFSLAGQSYSLPLEVLPQLPVNTKQVLLLITPQADKSSVNIQILQPQLASKTNAKSLVDFTGLLYGQVNNGKIQLNDKTFDLAKDFKLANVKNGAYQLTIEDKQLKLTALNLNDRDNKQNSIKSDAAYKTQLSVAPDNKNIFSVKAETLPNKLLAELKAMANPFQHGIHLLKQYQFSEQTSQLLTKLAGVEIKLDRRVENQTVSQGVKLANVNIHNNTVKFQLLSNEKYQFLFPEKAIIHQFLQQLNNEPQFEQFNILNQLKTQLTKDGGQIIESLLRLISQHPKNALQFNLSSDGKISISKQTAPDVQIPLTQALKIELSEQKLLSESSLLNTPKQLMSTISEKALLQNILNQTQPALLNQTMLTELKHQIEILQTTNRPLHHTLQQILHLLESSKATSLITANSPITNLSTQKSPPSVDDVKNQILSQLSAPLISPQLTAINQNNNSIANQMVAALQILFSRTAKATAKNPTSTLEKTNEKTSEKTTDKNVGSKESTLDRTKPSENEKKMTKLLADGVRNIQLNQQKTAKSHAEQHPQIFATIPFNINGDIRQAELAIDIAEDEENENTNAVKMWRFSIKFDLGQAGKMLTKAVLIDDKLKINVYTEEESLKQQAENTLEFLTKRLKLFGIELAEAGFNHGKIPERMWHESALSMQYRR